MQGDLRAVYCIFGVSGRLSSGSASDWQLRYSRYMGGYSGIGTPRALQVVHRPDLLRDLRRYWAILIGLLVHSEANSVTALHDGFVLLVGYSIGEAMLANVLDVARVQWSIRCVPTPLAMGLRVRCMWDGHFGHFCWSPMLLSV